MPEMESNPTEMSGNSTIDYKAMYEEQHPNVVQDSEKAHMEANASTQPESDIKRYEKMSTDNPRVAEAIQDKRHEADVAGEEAGRIYDEAKSVLTELDNLVVSPSATEADRADIQRYSGMARREIEGMGFPGTGITGENLRVDLTKLEGAKRLLQEINSRNTSVS